MPARRKQPAPTRSWRFRRSPSGSATTNCCVTTSKSSSAIGIPVIVQDASGYVGRPMSIALQARLLDEFGDQVLYKPEANPDRPAADRAVRSHRRQGQSLRRIGRHCPGRKPRRGIVGTMPGADMIDALVALWRALENGDQRRVDRLAPLVGDHRLAANQPRRLPGRGKIPARTSKAFSPTTLVRGPVGYALDDVTRRQVDRWFGLLQEALSYSP